MKLDLNKIDNMDFSIDYSDYPKFTDSYIEAADYDGREMTDKELDWLHDNEPEFVYDAIWNYIH